MIPLYLLTAFIVGVIVGISYAKRAVKVAIYKADICNEDRRFMFDTLGIPLD